MTTTAMRPAHLGLALIIIAVWGVNFAIIKVGLHGVPPLLLAAVRFVLAAFPALLFLRPPKVPLRLYIAYGMTISVGQFAFLFTAIHVGMPSGLASLVLQSQALFTLLLTAFFLKEKWHANQLVGLLLAAGGLILIGSAHGVAMPLTGFLLTIAAAVMWACGNIVSRAVGRYGPMNQLAFVVWSSLVPPMPLLALAWYVDGGSAIWQSVQHFSLQSLGAVIYIAWASTLFGYAAWNFLLSRYPINRVAPFSLLVPLVGLTTGWLSFHEVLGAVQLAGAILLMIGLLINLFGATLLKWIGWSQS
ncbi:O-acetylserine/cysteine efflux transporter [Herbaspirillum sp. Sphag1AN]|uniref:EamA family transporter n=1 Tax=unclassified Herbaspirillum TaxID=2624150 RepID=UPI0017BBE23A|nr:MULTISPECIES: EamA family transporter [unclassified Herbaspirillum]MBB3211516.1 O-acetylserine/cysteine efflux transporter [Herbaspirillum sp. Sphag1AN]MBB3245218.1 O-acetylserine/cysteine efflux transporter [Herbaspirillum sp. Sphag64]